MSAVAFLGLGRMGLPMAANLVARGHEVTVWNRTAATAAASWATAPVATRAEARGAAVDRQTSFAHPRRRSPRSSAPVSFRPGSSAPLPRRRSTTAIATKTPSPIATLHGLSAQRTRHSLRPTISGSVAATTTRTLPVASPPASPAPLSKAREVLARLGEPSHHNGEGAAQGPQLEAHHRTQVLHRPEPCGVRGPGPRRESRRRTEQCLRRPRREAVAAPFVHTPTSELQAKQMRGLTAFPPRLPHKDSPLVAPSRGRGP